MPRFSDRPRIQMQMEQFHRVRRERIRKFESAEDPQVGDEFPLGAATVIVKGVSPTWIVFDVVHADPRKKYSKTGTMYVQRGVSRDDWPKVLSGVSFADIPSIEHLKHEQMTLRSSAKIGDSIEWTSWPYEKTFGPVVVEKIKRDMGWESYGFTDPSKGGGRKFSWVAQRALVAINGREVAWYGDRDQLRIGRPPADRSFGESMIHEQYTFPHITYALDVVRGLVGQYPRLTPVVELLRDAHEAGMAGHTHRGGPLGPDVPTAKELVDQAIRELQTFLSTSHGQPFEDELRQVVIQLGGRVLEGRLNLKRSR